MNLQRPSITLWIYMGSNLQKPRMMLPSERNEQWYWNHLEWKAPNFLGSFILIHSYKSQQMIAFYFADGFFRAPRRRLDLYWTEPSLLSFKFIIFDVLKYFVSRVKMLSHLYFLHGFYIECYKVCFLLIPNGCRKCECVRTQYYNTHQIVSC